MDMNITKRVDERMNSYGLLICNMRIIYSECNFVMIPIIVDASGVKVSNIMLKNWHLVTKKLENNTKVKQFIVKICKMLKIWNS